MRVLAEERKQKTDQLLLTAPVSVEKNRFWKISCTGYDLCNSNADHVCVSTAHDKIRNSISGSSIHCDPWIFLLGCANLAIGVFISSLTESQVIAAVLTFVILFAFYMMNGISSFFSEGALSTCVTFGLLILAAAIIIYTMIKNFLISAVICVVGEIALVIVYVVNSSFFSGGIQKILDIFNLSSHFDNFANAIFDVKGVLYFVSVIAVCLFLTVQSIAKRRWN